MPLTSYLQVHQVRQSAAPTLLRYFRQVTASCCSLGSSYYNEINLANIITHCFDRAHGIAHLLSLPITETLLCSLPYRSEYNTDKINQILGVCQKTDSSGLRLDFSFRREVFVNFVNLSMTDSLGNCCVNMLPFIKRVKLEQKSLIVSVVGVFHFPHRKVNLRVLGCVFIIISCRYKTLEGEIAHCWPGSKASLQTPQQGMTHTGDLVPGGAQDQILSCEMFRKLTEMCVYVFVWKQIKCLSERASNMDEAGLKSATGLGFCNLGDRF